MDNKSMKGQVESGPMGDSGEAEASSQEKNTDKKIEHAEHTALDVIPQVLWLLTQSPKHKYMFLADMEWYFLPPFRLRQFRMFNHNNAPVAFACWAQVSDEVEERLKTGAPRLKPEEWNSGDNLCLMDLCAPFGGGEAALKELRENVFKDRKVKSLQSAPDGNGMAVVEW